MTVGEQIILGTLIVYTLTLFVFMWQSYATRQEMRKTAIRNVYDRYLEITKMEVQYPELHKMFVDEHTLRMLDQLSENQVKQRALSMFMFDQFALIFNLGERKSLVVRIDNILKQGSKTGRVFRWWNRRVKKSRLLAKQDRIVRKMLNRSVVKWWNRRVEASKTLFDINEDYIRHVMSNPVVVKCWRDWKLGETWKGSEYYDYINNLIENVIRKKDDNSELEDSSKESSKTND